MKLLQFALAHQGELAAGAAVLVALLRAVPESFWAQNPRLGQLFRLARAIGPDFVKGYRALRAALMPNGGSGERFQAAESPRRSPPNLPEGGGRS